MAIAKTKKEVGVMAAIKAYSQMEDHNNHLQEAKEVLSTLLIKGENNTKLKREDLQWKIDTQKGVVDYSRVLYRQGVSTYEKLSKASDSVGGVLYALEGQLACAQRNDSVA